MVDQLARPKDQMDVYWFSEQAQGYISDGEIEQFDSGRLGFPNSHFDPAKAHQLYNEYHEQYILADEVGFDGIMTNEHHAAYWCGSRRSIWTPPSSPRSPRMSRSPFSAT